MNNFYFRRDFEFSLHNKAYIMRSNLDDGWQLEDKETERIIFIKTNELHRHFLNGKLTPKVQTITKLRRINANHLIEESLSDLNAMSLHKVNIRLEFIKYFNKYFPKSLTLKNIETAINSTWNVGSMDKKPSASTAYRWIRNYANSYENPLSLLSRETDRGSKGPRINKATIDLCLDVIHRFYLSKERITIERTFEHIQNAIFEENKIRIINEKHNLPSLSTVRRLINSINKYDVDKARFGKQFADLRYHVVTDQTPSYAVNYRWEIDHTPMDVIAKDDQYGLIIGRPILTVIIDTRSRCIVAAYVSFEECSAVRVLNALRQAILPKDEILEKYPRIQNEWPCYGLPDLLFSDRGKEFLGKNLYAFCLAMSIDMGKARVQRGDDKGTVERIAGLINRIVTEKLPGKTFSSIQKKGHGYNPKKNAEVSLSVIKEAVFRSVCDIYHQDFHSSLGMTPLEKWKQEVDARGLRLPYSIEFLDANICVSTTKKITNMGIQHNNLPYSSTELKRIVHDRGYVEAEIKWNPEDLGHILVSQEGGGYLKVPLNKAFFEYGNGLDLKVHQIIKKNMPKGNSIEKALYLARKKDQIHDDILQDVSNKKSSLGKKQLHLLNNLNNSKNQKNNKLISPEELPTLDDIYTEDVPNLGVI